MNIFITILFLLAASVFGQAPKGMLDGQSGTIINFSLADKTAPFKVGPLSTLPATCTKGDFFYATDESIAFNNRLRHCYDTDGWTSQVTPSGVTVGYQNNSFEWASTVGAITAGTNVTVTLPSCPAGVKLVASTWAEQGFWVVVQGGGSTSEELAKVVGGTCAGDLQEGTLVLDKVTVSRDSSGQLATAYSGLQEAINAVGSASFLLNWGGPVRLRAQLMIKNFASAQMVGIAGLSPAQSEILCSVGHNDPDSESNPYRGVNVLTGLGALRGIADQPCIYFTQAGSGSNTGRSSLTNVTVRGGGEITAATNASTVAMTSAAHGMPVGQQVPITIGVVNEPSGDVGKWGAVLGAFTATIVDANTFTIPVNTSVGVFGACSSPGDAGCFATARVAGYGNTFIWNSRLTLVSAEGVQGGPATVQNVGLWNGGRGLFVGPGTNTSNFSNIHIERGAGDGIYVDTSNLAGGHWISNVTATNNSSYAQSSSAIHHVSTVDAWAGPFNGANIQAFGTYKHGYLIENTSGGSLPKDMFFICDFCIADSSFRGEAVKVVKARNIHLDNGFFTSKSPTVPAIRFENVDEAHVRGTVIYHSGDSGAVYVDGVGCPAGWTGSCGRALLLAANIYVYDAVGTVRWCADCAKDASCTAGGGAFATKTNAAGVNPATWSCSASDTYLAIGDVGIKTRMINSSFIGNKLTGPHLPWYFMDSSPVVGDSIAVANYETRPNATWTNSLANYTLLFGRISMTSRLHAIFHEAGDGTGGYPWILQDSGGTKKYLRVGTNGCLEIINDGFTANLLSVCENGTDVGLRSWTSGNLDVVPNAIGQIKWCSDCQKANPCAGGGSGALAVKAASGLTGWRCDQ